MAIAGRRTVDATNIEECQTALWLFENLYFGLELPDAWINPMPSASGFVWDAAGAPDPDNGQCVVGVGYTAAGITIDTWGMTGLMTNEAGFRWRTLHSGEHRRNPRGLRLDGRQRFGASSREVINCHRLRKFALSRSLKPLCTLYTGLSNLLLTNERRGLFSEDDFAQLVASHERFRCPETDE